MKKQDIITSVLLIIFIVIWTMVAFWALTNSDWIESGPIGKAEHSISVRVPAPVISTPEPTEPVEEEYVDKPFEVAAPRSGRELYDFYVDQIHEQYYPDVPTAIVRAVMEIESHYQPDVQSSAGAVGLMQLLPQYHAQRGLQYGLTDIWDPYTNIICGVDLLSELYQAKGNWRDALYGYNRSWAYVDHVLTLADDISKEGG